MSEYTVVGAEGVCAGCHQRTRPGAAFCGHCGRAVDSPARDHRVGGDGGPWPARASIPTPRHGTERPPGPPPSTTVGTDGPAGPASPADVAGGTTRFLGAAMHLDEDLAETFIAEFLVEPYRSVPRSPGVDAHSVLGDAAAAHRRRQWRDALLVLLAVVVAVGQTSLFLLWLLVGIGMTLTGQRRNAAAALSKARVAGLLVLVVLGLAATALSGAALLVMTQLAGSSSISSGPFSSTVDTIGAVGMVGVVALICVPAVILLDELVAVAVVRRHFSRQRFRHEPDPADGGFLAGLRRLGRGRFGAALARTRAAEQRRDTGDAEVVVFRGDTPFVGAGEGLAPRSLVIPLENEDGDVRRPPHVSPHELHRHVATSMRNLRRRSSLSPHGRLGWCRIEDKILVSAQDLVAHWPSAEAQMYLPAGAHAPTATTVSSDVVHQSIGAPREWARHYQCFQVEGWERDLAVSFYFTLGTDGHLLYLEWVPRVLAPIDASYRVIDDVRELRRRALRRALLDVAAFPATLAERVRRACRSFAPVPAAPDELVPEKYGSAGSLRELAAGSLGDYFHAADVNRYTELFDRSILEAVREYLRARGLKIADLDRAAGSIFTVHATNSTVAVGQNSSAASGTAAARKGQ